jgi:two-component SAPR family response regulator
MTIMIIEDDKVTLKLYTESLKEKHKLHAYENPGEAFKYYVAHAFEFDLIIVDNQLPGRNGKSLIHDMKMVNPKQKIIVISADPEFVVLPEKFEVEKYQKPMLGEKLEAAVNKACGVSEFKWSKYGT